ncbi:WD40 repeat domain-containing protein [Limnospira fusiformis SAG 85.79]|nr:WD40 repeat domain-containing protein [Limnospira fusiformis SAG 85.79]
MVIIESGNLQMILKLTGWKYAAGLGLTTLTAIVGLTVLKTGTQLLVSSPDMSSLSYPSLTLNGHSAWVYAAAIAPDGKVLASGSYDGTIKIWDLESGSLRQTIAAHASAVASLAIAPDGKHLISGSVDNRVRLWDLDTGKLIRTFNGHRDDVKVVAIAPDGKTIASGSADKTIRLWNLQGETLATLQDVDWVRALAFTPDSQYLLSGCEDGTIGIWQLQDGKKSLTIQAHSGVVRAIAVSPDGQLFASGSDDRTITLWNASNRSILNTLTGHSHRVQSLAWSPDGSTLVSGSHDRTVRLWNVAEGKVFDTLQAHAKSVQAVVFSPDGRQFVSASSDQTIKLWPIDPKSPTDPKPAIASESPNIFTEITQSTELEQLNQILYERIDGDWQSVEFAESLAYQVTVNREGAITSYQPLHQKAADFVTKTPLPNLRTEQNQADFAYFHLVLHPSGAIEVSPWRGWDK